MERAQRHGRHIDMLAIIVLIGYTFLSISAQTGTNLAGQGLDPVWAAARQRGRLRVATDFGFYPFSSIAHNQPIGYDIDLANAIAQKLGLRAEFVPSSLDSIYDDLANRKADMGASALPYTPEQGWRVRFSSFYFNAGQVLVVPEESALTQHDQLGGHTIGVQLGSDADTYARKLALEDSSIVVRSSYDTPDEVLTDLRHGNISAAIVDNAAALSNLGHRPGLRLVTALTLEPYALAVSAEAYQLHSEINRALEALRSEGFFEQLGKKWFVEAPRPT